LSAAACVSVLLASIAPASAQVVIFGEEVGPDVVFTVSGSFDPGAPTPGNDFSVETIFEPSSGEFEAWQTATIVNRFALDATVPFGTGLLQEDVGIGAGDNFAIFGDELYLDNTHVAGTPINTTLTFAGTTLADLGVDVAGGPYVWTVTNSAATITMLFTLPAPTVDNSALRTSLSKKIKKLKKEARLAKRKGQSAKAKRLLKKAMKCQKRLKALG
jgi:hypothetical protein